MKKIIILLISLLVLLYGCVGNTDITQLIKQSQQGKEFLNAYPNADVTAVRLSVDAVTTVIDQIRQDCDHSIPIKSYWKVKLSDHDSHTELVSYIDAETQEAVCFVKKNTQKKEAQPTQQINNQNNIPTNSDNPSNNNNCPAQGTLQSDYSYCVDLCMLNESDADMIKEFCTDVCNMGKYTGGTEGLQKYIQDFKCPKCGDCTVEQLRKIEYDKKQAEELRITNAKIAEESKKRTEEAQRIKEENAKIQQQENIELEKNIPLQSAKLGGFVMIKNKSGEGRQYTDNGITYYFPYPAKEPVKVPVDFGRELLATGNFELVIT